MDDKKAAEPEQTKPEDSRVMMSGAGKGHGPPAQEQEKGPSNAQAITYRLIASFALVVI